MFLIKTALKVLLFLFFFNSSWELFSADLYTCSFGQGKWKPEEWRMVKSWRWDYAGEWVQKSDFIENKVPGDATPKELFSKRAGETYTSMVLDKKFRGNLTIACDMSFIDRMAPGIMIAAEPVKDEKGRWEYRDHFEVIFYDKGVNVWHHYFVDGKQVWKKKAFLLEDFKPEKVYKLSVNISFTPKGPVLTMKVNDGAPFGYMEEALPKEYYLGIVGCEGVNRFYDLKISK